MICQTRIAAVSILTLDNSSSDDDDFERNSMASPIDTSNGTGNQPAQSHDVVDGQNEKENFSISNTVNASQTWESQGQTERLTRPHDLEIDTNVDEMKIQTMYKMVEDCKVSVMGNEIVKRILYLTNKQAVLFDEIAMERCIQALDIGDPKVISVLQLLFTVCINQGKLICGTVCYQPLTIARSKVANGHFTHAIG